MRTIKLISLFWFLSFAGNDVRGQIIYTDLIPDRSPVTSQTYPGVYIPGTPVNIDLNNDGIMDYSFQSTYSYSSHITSESFFMIPLNNNIVIDTTKLQANDPINWNYNWTHNHQTLSSSTITQYNTFYGGFWGNGNVEGFLGLQIEVNGNYYFGWVRLRASAGITDYAYEINGNPLYAGQMTIGVDENSKNENLITVYPAPFQSALNLKIEQPSASSLKININNIYGQLVYTNCFENTSNVVNLHLDNLSSGIYFLSAEVDGKKVIKKIIKE